MPEFISVEEFISETLEDYSSPTTSSFITKMTSCRNSVNNIEEVGCCFYSLQPTEQDTSLKMSMVITATLTGACRVR